MMTEMRCPDCGCERADYEGPDGQWLATCPNCGTTRDPVSPLWLEIFDLEVHPLPGYDDWSDRVTDALRIIAIELDKLRNPN